MTIGTRATITIMVTTMIRAGAEEKKNTIGIGTVMIAIKQTFTAD